MCRLGRYLAASILLAIAIEVLPLPSVSGLELWARSALERGVVSQTVDRRHKTDRLIFSTRTIRDIAPSRPAPAPSRPVQVGCDPAFSPLSASARLNYPIRCLADNKAASTGPMFAHRRSLDGLLMSGPTI